MISHIPPGALDNWAEYGHRYLKLTRKFNDTIIGNLFGHTHMDQFQLVDYNN